MSTPKHILKPGQQDYQRIVSAIGYLRAHHDEQPDLATLARHTGLSEHHFQRLFTRWAGVSPKRFLQHLTLEDARQRLAASRSVLDLSGELGLSGGGRLHDLFVTVEAMSPGEARSGGAGLDIHWGLHDSPFGPALIASTHRGICALHFLDDKQQDPAALLGGDWPEARLKHSDSATRGLAQRIFAPLDGRRREPLALLLKGSNFQLQVWRALLRLPPGALTSYGDLATALDAPTAARAIGSAVGANRIGWLIPCHRVIRAGGEITGYRWGSSRKAAMLGWEAARSEVV